MWAFQCCICTRCPPLQLYILSTSVAGCAMKCPRPSSAALGHSTKHLTVRRSCQSHPRLLPASQVWTSCSSSLCIKFSACHSSHPEVGRQVPASSHLLPDGQRMGPAVLVITFSHRIPVRTALQSSKTVGDRHQAATPQCERSLDSFLRKSQVLRRAHSAQQISIGHV